MKALFIIVLAVAALSMLRQVFAKRTNSSAETANNDSTIQLASIRSDALGSIRDPNELLTADEAPATETGRIKVADLVKAIKEHQSSPKGEADIDFDEGGDLSALVKNTDPFRIDDLDDEDPLPDPFQSGKK